MKNRIANFFRWISLYEVRRDLSNYLDWIRIISRERDNPDSKFNKFRMNHNLFYIIYFPISLPEEDRELPDKIKRLRVIESLKPVHLYLDDELGFAEYLVPEFSQFFDDENNPTLTYGIIYRFGFKRFSLSWLIKRVIFWIVATLLFFSFNGMEFLKEIFSKYLNN